MNGRQQYSIIFLSAIHHLAGGWGTTSEGSEDTMSNEQIEEALSYHPADTSNWIHLDPRPSTFGTFKRELYALTLLAGVIAGLLIIRWFVR